MKKLIATTLLAAVAFAAFAAKYEHVTLVGPARGLFGKVVAFDVQSTNATQTATLKRIRDISAYTNALDVSTRVVTNVVYFPETVVTNGATNVVQGVSNVVSTVTTTNGYRRVLAARQCVTNTLATATCVNGFATTNVSDWVLRDDAIWADCSDPAAKATLIIEK